MSWPIPNVSITLLLPAPRTAKMDKLNDTSDTRTSSLGKMCLSRCPMIWLAPSGDAKTRADWPCTRTFATSSRPAFEVTNAVSTTSPGLAPSTLAVLWLCKKASLSPPATCRTVESDLSQKTQHSADSRSPSVKPLPSLPSPAANEVGTEAPPANTAPPSSWISLSVTSSQPSTSSISMSSRDLALQSTLDLPNRVDPNRLPDARLPFPLREEREQLGEQPR
mmetsp:Transcript_3185/g.8824  ORF Transcript_3185/g.8824 Transcript_3185/m.8824 type:complete len:222 (-) Transcript_3185:250-915(-)